MGLGSNAPGDELGQLAEQRAEVLGKRMRGIVVFHPGLEQAPRARRILEFWVGDAMQKTGELEFGLGVINRERDSGLELGERADGVALA